MSKKVRKINEITYLVDDKQVILDHGKIPAQNDLNPQEHDFLQDFLDAENAPPEGEIGISPKVSSIIKKDES